MARKRREKRRGGAREATRRHAQPARDETRPAAPQAREHVALLVLIGAGVLLTTYLTAVQWFGTAPLYCSAGSGCDLVQSSRWSVLLGLPLPLWGLLTYAILAGLVWRMRRRRSTWTRATFVAGVAAAISVYLTVISVYEIEALCFYCLASLAIILSVLAVLLWRRPAQIAGFEWRSFAPATLLSAVLAVVALHLHWSGIFDPSAGPEKPYLKALATHLDAEGARFFGAYWCPHCKDQKALFEASASRLPYVECTPEGRNGPVNVACVAQGVQDYPTWIIGGRRFTGVQTPARLAAISNFVWSEPVPAQPPP